MDKIKYFLVLTTVIIVSMSICAATDNDNMTQTQDTSIQSITENNNEIYTPYNNPENEKTITKKISENNKNEENTNITTITEDNYNNYLSVSNNRITLNQQYFIPGNNYIINFNYIPTGKKLEINNFNNTQYAGDTIKIGGNLQDTNLIVNKSNLKSLILEDLTLDYNQEYEGEYVKVNSAILNRVTINVDTTRDITTIPLYIDGKGTVVENSTINARIPSSQIPWNEESTSVPKAIGVWINSDNVKLANNTITIEESAILSYGGFNSIFGIYNKGNNVSMYNNIFTLTGTQYTYGLVIRSSNNKIFDNYITDA